MDGIRKIVKLVIEIGKLKHLQDIDIGTSDRREKINEMTKEVEDIFDTFHKTKPSDHTECYFALGKCYAFLNSYVHDDDLDLRIFNRFKNDNINDLDKFNLSLMTLDTDIDLLLYDERVKTLRCGDLIVCSFHENNNDVILQVKTIRGVRNGYNVVAVNKHGKEFKINKYQLSCCNRIISHHFSSNQDAIEKLDVSCLLERLIDITMNKIFNR